MIIYTYKCTPESNITASLPAINALRLAYRSYDAVISSQYSCRQFRQNEKEIRLMCLSFFDFELQFFFNAPIYREPKFQRVKWTNSKWANQMHIYYSFSAEITLLVDFYFIPVHFISIFISMLCMPIGRARLLHECEHKTRSRSRAIWNCACPLIVCMRYCVVLWKLDAHQPVKPPFSTALNKTMRFIRSGSEVKCCAVLFALLHTSHLRLRHFSIFYSRFRCTFAVCAFLLNESISIHCRLVLLICIAFTALVCSHNLCAEYTHTAFMLLLTDQHFLIQTTWNIRKKGANR